MKHVITRRFGTLRLSLAGVPLAAFLIGAAGCMQIETRVKIEKDGSATVTERVRFSQRLFDLAHTQEDSRLEAFLDKARVLVRVGKMGKGARLASHEVRDAADGARECVSVVKIPDMNDLRYVSPFMGHFNYPKHSVLRFKLAPCYRSPGYGLWPGQMYVAVWPATKERAPRRPKGWRPPPGPTPAELQVYRDLKPVFRDMLQGFQVRLVVESYAPIGMARGYYRYRGIGAGTRECDLIDFSWNDLDRHGAEFLDNEEIMLELVRFQMVGGDLTATTKQHAENWTVPVYHPHGVPNITFRPSRQLFDRHFKGKKLQFSKKRGGPRMANYREIGLRDERKDAPKKPKGKAEGR
jgi:hypothetical protein